MKVTFPILNIGSGGKVYFELINKYLKKEGIKSEIILENKRYEFFPSLLKLHNQNYKTDIIHSNAEYGHAFKKKRVPLMVTIHHNVFDKEYRKDITPAQKIFHDYILKRNIRKSFKRADVIVAVSNSTKKSIINTFGNFDIKVIYNGVDTEKFKPLRTKKEDKKFKLLFVGNLIRRKGADLLPKIMERLGDQYVLYYTAGLRTKVSKHFHLPNMIPLNKLSDEEIIKEYNKCDALLFPSRLEGFGYAIAEAMACGKPVIATNCSSIPEIVKDGENGYLCKLDDVNDFVNKIKKLTKNKKLLSANSNRKKIIDSFSLEKMGDRYVQEYNKLAK